MPKRHIYPRLLRLRHVHLTGWQRAALGEGVVALAAVLVLADVATAWTLVVLPLAMAAVVKAHDVLAGLLAPAPAGGREAERENAGTPGGTGAGDARVG